MFQVFTKFPIKDAVSVHFVEVSPTLSDMQKVKLQGETAHVEEPVQSDQQQIDSFSYKHCRSKHGFNVSWYKQLKDVPKAPSMVIAHEFLDALPIHKFQVSHLSGFILVCTVILNVLGNICVPPLVTEVNISP
jgi:NADH dehydrogenase [ubiquinone] 1 alpha subcomplex assembly factor 7